MQDPVIYAVQNLPAQLTWPWRTRWPMTALLLHDNAVHLTRHRDPLIVVPLATFLYTFTYTWTSYDIWQIQEIIIRHKKSWLDMVSSAKLLENHNGNQCDMQLITGQLFLQCTARSQCVKVDANPAPILSAMISIHVLCRLIESKHNKIFLSPFIHIKHSFNKYFYF